MGMNGWADDTRMSLKTTPHNTAAERSQKPCSLRRLDETHLRTLIHYDENISSASQRWRTHPLPSTTSTYVRHWPDHLYQGHSTLVLAKSGMDHTDTWAEAPSPSSTELLS